MTNKGVGFVGLGQMGRGMARNLSKDVSSFYVYDKLEGARKSLCDTDAILTDSLAYLSKNCDLIFLCLPSAKDVDEVIFGRCGILKNCRSNLSIIDNSTIDRTEAVRFNRVLAKQKVKYADCPISGLPSRAADGTLTLMFGGERELFDEVESILGFMGEFIVYCGPAGSGQLMKAVNNIIYDINIVALCEILPLAVAGGLSVDAVERVVTTASARSFAADHFIPRILKRQFKNDFAMADAYKDILNMQGLAVEKKAMTPLMNSMATMYQSAITNGFGREPKSAIIKIYEKALDTKFTK